MTQLEHQSRGQFNAPNLEFLEGRGWKGDETNKTFLSMGIFLNDTGMALDHELMARSGQQSSRTLTLSQTNVCKFIIVMLVW